MLQSMIAGHCELGERPSGLDFSELRACDRSICLLSWSWKFVLISFRFIGPAFGLGLGAINIELR